MQIKLPEGVVGRALFSDDKVYRYSLIRRWREGKGTAIFIMLNPSTADESTNDPTVNRCMLWAMRNGYRRLVILNAFALRSTDPKALAKHADPVGPTNDETILHALNTAQIGLDAIDGGRYIVICGWGTHGALLDRGSKIKKLLTDHGYVPHVFATTMAGHPGHPLYIKNEDMKPRIWK